jgi:integrase
MQEIKVPTVRLAKPKARPIQLRYTDPTTKAEVRISTGTSASAKGKVISRIGEAAGVIVRPAVGKGKPKYASAHDLRRSCAERLVSAGVPEREVSRVLRHADVQTTRRHYAPGTVQDSAGIIRRKLTAVTSEAT